MRPLEVEYPGAGKRTGAMAMVHRKSECFYYNRSSAEYQAICRRFFLESLISADGFFEPELSLAIDRAVLQVEALLWT